MTMEIVQAKEAFKRIDGRMKFSYVQIFAHHDGLLYTGKWMNRLELPRTFEDLQEVKQIPTEDRGPSVDSTWSAVYIKTPSLLAYADCENLEAYFESLDSDDPNTHNKYSDLLKCWTG